MFSYKSNLPRYLNHSTRISNGQVMAKTQSWGRRGKPDTILGQLELHISSSWGVFPIYRVLFPNLRSYFRNKICFSLLRIILLRNKELNMFFLNKELSFWEIRDLETRKSVDKYLLPRIFRLNVFIHNEFSKCGRMAGWGTRIPYGI